MTDTSTLCTAFEGTRQIATGPLGEVALKVKAALAKGNGQPILIFDDTSGGQFEIDTRGTDEDILKRLKSGDEPRGPGRPKIGVTAREVTLLPRHWDWLNAQPGGASASIRRLVEDARRASGGKDRMREAQNAAYRFMSAMAGNEPDFEDAVRALFAGKKKEMLAFIDPWPGNIRDHIKRLSEGAF